MVITLLALQDTGIVAYAQVRRNTTAPACVTHPEAIELQRFYADRSVHGTGLALRLMRRALDAARELGGRYAWLGVWERNPRAIAFYRRSGFEAVGVQVYPLGSDLQRDVVMARPAARSPRPAS